MKKITAKLLEFFIKLLKNEKFQAWATATCTALLTEQAKKMKEKIEERDKQNEK